MTLMAAVDVLDLMARAREEQAAAKTFMRRYEIQRCITWCELRLDDLRDTVDAERNALRRIAARGKRQAMISEEITFWRWCDERFGNPGALTLRHYQFIRGFVHG